MHVYQLDQDAEGQYSVDSEVKSVSLKGRILQAELHPAFQWLVTLNDQQCIQLSNYSKQHYIMNIPLRQVVPGGSFTDFALYVSKDTVYLLVLQDNGHLFLSKFLKWGSEVSWKGLKIMKTNKTQAKVNILKMIRGQGKEVDVIVGGNSGYFTCLPKFNELIDNIEAQGDNKTQPK